MSPFDPGTPLGGSEESPTADYRIRRESRHLEWQPQILKQGNTFAVLNPYGDIITLDRSEEGLFHEDTRFLSHYELRINNTRPLLLASSVTRDNSILHVHLTSSANSAIESQQNIHVGRSIYLWQGTLLERLSIRNYSSDSSELLVQYAFESDFADIFEVRGLPPRFRGERLITHLNKHGVEVQYNGRDQITRSAHIEFDPAPSHVLPTSATHAVTLKRRETTYIYSSVRCIANGEANVGKSFAAGLRASKRRLRAKRHQGAKIYTANELFNEWLNRSLADLYTLVSRTDHGSFPYAGIPWFNTPFGRDGIITALQCLWMDPSIARGVLGYLADAQATEFIPDSDAAPGKILHETRRGEMANLGEVPFKQYYGTVDATPLFIILAGEYFSRTGDKAFIQEIWPNINQALAWIDDTGDIDGDGFIEYERSTDTGLRNQGWKDSDDSIFHRDGTLAVGPIALCEVQGYVFAARQAMSLLAETLGLDEQAKALRAQAEQLRQKFEQAFWSEDLGTYVLALDGDKRQCIVRSSNAGHALFTGIASPERAQHVADMLSSRLFFSGWGIRTLATTEARYNPMSYHNGSVWPHDNAIVAMGLARYGMKAPIVAITRSMFEASTYLKQHRLPELFCGFTRRAETGPILYPSACSPQAWSSSTAVALLNALLGISFDAAANKILINKPHLPQFLQSVELRGLRLGGGSVDLTFSRTENDVAVVTDARDNDISIVISS